uniref:Kinesin-like protein n=1 Tax=Acrobeloides nanus TaxID=290746 RepID=A0A914DWM7_9BILA
MVNDDDNTSVKVALRIRPQNAREKAQQCRICTSVTPGEPQVTIGSDKSFTFDFVFDQPTAQNTIYEAIAEKLVEGTFDGYNATVLAYGQTGSGKTYTMGTAYDAAGTLPEFDLGIIPRAAQHIFNGIMERKLRAKEQGRVEPIFDISVQFVELYNEDIIDLLSEDRNTQANIKIGENVEKGEIYLKGVHSQTVKSPLDILNVLKNGALNRTTAATNMNQQSSRSHAIFTISMKQQRMAPIDIPTSAENGVSESAPTTPTESELEVLTAKFHFVDLAGSERLKRTGATGDRAKEGISINCGLLALGNVISALGGAQGKVSHVPYRDSKLTRLLQDSLGGNSRTLMIACASPSDVDFVETLNTLNYANRAKNIKNKVVANQDKTSKIVGELRGRIAALEAELNEYKQGKRIIGEDGQETLNDQYHENIFLQSEVNRLRTRVKALQETAEVLRGRNVTLQVELSRLTSAGLIPSGGDENANPMNGDANDHDPIASTIRNYLEEIENLKTQLIEAHATSDELRKQISKMKSQFGVGLISNSSSVFNSPVAAGGGGLVGYSSTTAVIKAAKEEIEREKKKIVEELDDEATTVEDEMNEDEVLDEDETMHDEDEEDSEDEQENDTKERDRICNDLATLQEEISIKEQLVIQLEQSEARLAQVRRDYERKLAELSQRISSTESERDRILADINAKSTNSKATEEKVKVVKEEYERKINTMRKEFSKLQALEREHERMRNQQSRQQNELKKYQHEIQEMKKNKVELMKQLKEENKRVKELERTNAKRLAGMEKESRQKDNRIRMLESRDRQREEFMKRKTEEYNNKLKQQNNGRPANARLRSSNMATQNSVMRNQQNRTVTRNTLNATFNVSQTPNRRGPLRDLINQSKVLTYSPVKAKKRWNAIEKGITRYIVQRQTLDTMTEEMNRQLAERESIRQEIQKLENNFYEVPLPGIEERYVIQEELKSVNEKLRYVEDQIERVQKEFVTVEESGMKLY